MRRTLVLLATFFALAIALPATAVQVTLDQAYITSPAPSLTIVPTAPSQAQEVLVPVGSVLDSTSPTGLSMVVATADAKPKKVLAAGSTLLVGTPVVAVASTYAISAALVAVADAKPKAKSAKVGKKAKKAKAAELGVKKKT